jgi:hypothetical protein
MLGQRLYELIPLILNHSRPGTVEQPSNASSEYMDQHLDG